VAKRRNFIPDFKARVALGVFRGDKTIQGISSKHKLHPNQVSTRKRQAMDGLGGCPGSHHQHQSSGGRACGYKVGLSSEAVLLQRHYSGPFVPHL
jgi:transposase